MTRGMHLIAGYFLAGAASLFIVGDRGTAFAASGAPIYEFANDGVGFPAAGVILDSAVLADIEPAGTLYGTTPTMVYALVPPSDGGKWVLQTLHTFPSSKSDGYDPVAELVADANGNLFGVTSKGGYTPTKTCNCGTVFELSPPATAEGSWTYSVLYRFTGGSDGATPTAAMILDPSGNGVLYGTANQGGAKGLGTVFALTPPLFAGTASLPANPGHGWQIRILLHFGPDYGAYPNGAMVFDNSGNLFGTTGKTGRITQCGLVFEAIPPANNGGVRWTEQLIHVFPATGNAKDGCTPIGRLIREPANGRLFGMTVSSSRAAGYGAVAFALTPPATETGTWHEVMIALPGRAGYDGLLRDPTTGTLYGTMGADADQGAQIFALTPTSNPNVWDVTTLWQSTIVGPVFSLTFGLNKDHLFTTTTNGGVKTDSCHDETPYGCGTVFELTQ